MLDLGKTYLQTAERCPTRTAIVDGQQRLNYQEWAGKIGAVQNALAECGIRKGDRILSILQNRFEAATLHWACQMAGVTIVPINWRSKPDEIDYCANDAAARLVVYEQVSAESYVASQTSARTQSVFCGSKLDTSRATLCFSDMLTNERDPAPQAKADDVSLMLYTSGTTGKPKGVPRLHRAERAAAIAHVAQNQYKSFEVTLGVMPLYHTMGVRSLLALCLISGIYIALPRWHPEAALDLIESEQITNLYLVPTLYHDLIESNDFKSSRVHSVSKLGFAGAPMHDGLLLRLNELFKPQLFVNHYGSSEIYTFSVNQDAVSHPGSAGIAGINSRIRVVKIDSPDSRSGPLDIAAPYQEGQIICDLDSDEAFGGYWQRPDANEKSLRDGWYFTGDTGYFDDSGHLYVTGRVDDMIISGGENISPVEIESVISLHPAVGEVAVVGVRDERLGQKVTAFISPRAKVSAEDLDRHCKSSDLQNFKRPREYVFVKEIPKSPVGKILRRKLVANEYELLDQKG